MIFNENPCKPKIFTAINSKNAQGYGQPNQDSKLHTHDEDHFIHLQILKLASGTYAGEILNRDKKQ